MNMVEFELMLNFIRDYEVTAQRLLEGLKEQFSIVNPVRAAIEKVIPRTGQLKDGTIYTIHGVGIRFESPDEEVIVDADLDMEGNCAGFDGWRLKSFAEGRPAYSGLESIVIDQCIEDMVRHGNLQKNSDTMTS